MLVSVGKEVAVSIGPIRIERLTRYHGKSRGAQEGALAVGLLAAPVAVYRRKELAV